MRSNWPKLASLAQKTCSRDETLLHIILFYLCSWWRLSANHDFHICRVYSCANLVMCTLNQIYLCDYFSKLGHITIDRICFVMNFFVNM